MIIGVSNEWSRLQGEHPELAEWTLAYRPRFKQTLGLCRHGTRQILLATWLTPEKAVDTLRHEAAHALCGHGAGHGRAWKAMCVRLGAEPTRLCREPENCPERAPHLWAVYCPGCKKVVAKRRRRTRGGKIHRKCGQVVEYRRLR